MDSPKARRVSVPRARQSYLFDHFGASAYPAISRNTPVDASDDAPPPAGTSLEHVLVGEWELIDGDAIPADAALVPPDLDPECWLDPEDPDSGDSDPQTWPAWTDGHRYAPTRGGGR